MVSLESAVLWVWTEFSCMLLAGSTWPGHSQSGWKGWKVERDKNVWDLFSPFFLVCTCCFSVCFPALTHHIFFCGRGCQSCIWLAGIKMELLFKTSVRTYHISSLKQVFFNPLKPILVCCTSDYQPAILFRTTSTIPLRLFTLLPRCLVISHPYFLKPWMSEIPLAFSVYTLGRTGDLLLVSSEFLAAFPTSMDSFTCSNKTEKKPLF